MHQIPLEQSHKLCDIYMCGGRPTVEVKNMLLWFRELRSLPLPWRHKGRRCDDLGNCLNGYNIATYGILSNDCNIEFKNLSVSSCNLSVDCWSCFCTSSCFSACSIVTSYGNSLVFPVSDSCWFTQTLYTSIGLVLILRFLSPITSDTIGCNISFKAFWPRWFLQIKL